MFRLNPYIAGDPIRAEQKFFGREDVLRSVKNVLQNPSANAIVLFGQRRIGKTSILLQLAARLSKEGVYTPVYFDLQDKASKPLAGLLYDLACGINEALGKEAPSPEHFDEEGEYFRKEFLPAAASAAPEGGLVLLFDEFDVLDSVNSRQAGQSFFPYLRQWMSEVSNVSFVFVIGRRPEDLSTDTHSAFKTVRASLVSRLDRGSAEAMIRQSEKEGSLIWSDAKDKSLLFWSDAAVERVWKLCQGHAFLTQLMCSVVFDRMNDSNPSDVAVVQDAHVDESVGEALNQGANAFHWLWGGLPPAERVVIAAMAEIKNDVITQEELIEKLNQSGVRLIVRELEIAPDTLTEWELLKEMEGGYSFTVPLIKHWVAKNRPLRRVKDELDRLDPLAEQLFQTGQSFYGIGQAGEAENQLRRSLEVNPNHLKSKLLLGRILVEGGRAVEAAAVLEEAYQYDQGAARAELVKALLVLAGDTEQEEQTRVQIYEKILNIDERQAVARERLAQIMRERRAREITERASLAVEKERQEDWSAAIEIYEELIRIDTDSSADWGEGLKRVRALEETASKYQQALGALETGERDAAVKLLAEVIHAQPYFKDSARHFLHAVTGTDVEQLQRKIRELESVADVKAEALARLRGLKAYDLLPEHEVQKLLQAFLDSLGTGDPEGFIFCPKCRVNLKAKNLPLHWLENHR